MKSLNISSVAPKSGPRNLFNFVFPGLGNIVITAHSHLPTWRMVCETRAISVCVLCVCQCVFYIFLCVFFSWQTSVQRMTYQRMKDEFHSYVEGRGLVYKPNTNYGNTLATNNWLQRTKTVKMFLGTQTEIFEYTHTIRCIDGRPFEVII